MEENKVTNNSKDAAEDTKAKKAEYGKLVRVRVSDKVSVIFPENNTTGKDIIAAVTYLAGMFYLARGDEEYRKVAGRSLKRAFKYVTSGEYEKSLNKYKKPKA